MCESSKERFKLPVYREENACECLRRKRVVRKQTKRYALQKYRGSGSISYETQVRGAQFVVVEVQVQFCMNSKLAEHNL
jgi:hypothetical protein